MRPFLILIALCTLAVAETQAPLPDIVVFISDDHSILDSEPYGATNIRTPNMQKLADEGIKFTHAFAASPSCGPSRTALLTGLWPARNGAEANHHPRRPDIPGLPTNLQAFGYEVVAIGKVAHKSKGASYQFDFTAGPAQGCTDSAALKKYLQTRTSTKPLCLFFGTHYPHTDWLANDGYDPASLPLPPTFIDTPATRSQRAEYLSSVTAADTLLGEVRALTHQFVTGDPLFIYTADHGAAWPFAKWDLYDAGIRVPFIVSWPGQLKTATTCDAMICLPDLFPTFIDLANGTAPAGLDGKSFAGILRGSTNQHRDRVFTTCSGDGDMNVYPSRSLRTRDFKYILNLHPEFQHHTYISLSPNPKHGRAYWESWQNAARENPTAAAVVKRYIQRPAEELYDLTSDPNELHNLAAEPAHAERLATMRQELKAWMKQQADSETVFGNPLLLTQPIPEPGLKPRKKKSSR